MRARRYFDLADDMTIPGRWSLDEPTDPGNRELDDPWMFRVGETIPDPGPLRIQRNRPGKPLDFTIAAFGIPVVHDRVAAVFAELAPRDIQLFPVEVQDQSEQFHILVATQLIRCIDDAACKEVELWTPEDGRPEKTGKYRDVWGMRIDPSKVGDAKVFRTWGWSIALIVSEEIKDALERIGATGVSFTEV
ncbi:imm11 family protein [Pyxidicoccus xibeiensis]|uniref:imm11 family protein n=1 Tax=Pyxidicoccus xibeiensis TaxID=2906759 RepID=UPI0020A752F9|nr:DUF1629 domain-containing protein [Pyxidicoccus xibeiensis]MCP3136717.1 hypothetical protein [Pyxidicoccus xibeiensis]